MKQNQKWKRYDHVYYVVTDRSATFPSGLDSLHFIQLKSVFSVSLPFWRKGDRTDRHSCWLARWSTETWRRLFSLFISSFLNLFFSLAFSRSLSLPLSPSLSLYNIETDAHSENIQLPKIFYRQVLPLYDFVWIYFSLNEDFIMALDCEFYRFRELRIVLVCVIDMTLSYFGNSDSFFHSQLHYFLFDSCMSLSIDRLV